ncbi:PREDICTED: nuclear pore complex protein Nup133-like [Acropora digitifera]|uniref:nuclear pore complex protein Nup133-like n=1 Tax=Acropora digitifera TaxID=70779 RepID=UPI00077A514E|nr:PREDICTED: nuclear pore complex protein Nup133-like [Acropora digitifera]
MASPWTRQSLKRKSMPSNRNSSPFTPRQSLNNSSLLGDSFSRAQPKVPLNSQLLEETDQHRVETYGFPLPVQISEVLTNKSGDHISAKIDPSGWAWLVIGRKLFIWRYVPSATSKGVFCKELTLPASEMHHSADLICVLSSGGDGGSNVSLVSIMAASPEGLVRYWPSLIHDSAVVDMETDLMASQCHSLTAFPPHSCILVTTNNELLLLSGSQKEIKCHNLNSSNSVFSDFGRRVSSFIFGELLVLSENQLFKWNIQQTGQSVFQEKLILCSSDIIILAAVSLGGVHSTQLLYSLGTLKTDTESMPSQLENFNILQYSAAYNESREQELLSFKLLLPPQNSSAFVYGSNLVICAPVNQADEVLNKIDLLSPGNSILGSGFHGNKPLFFSMKYGIITVTVTEAVVREQIDDSVLQTSKAHLTDVSIANVTFGETDDDMKKFKSAFLLFCQGNNDEAQSICNEIFTSGADLNSAVLTLSQELIDDFPVSDPRWAESIPAGLCVTVNLSRVKRNNLMKNTITPRTGGSLGIVKTKDVTSLTCHMICEHAEKLSAAVALCKVDNMCQQVLDESIGLAVKKRQVKAQARGLTKHDLFFREVSRISDIFECLLDYEEGVSGKQRASSSSILQTILAVNKIMREMLYEAWHYRQTNSRMYEPTNSSSAELNIELVPWTATGGPSGVRTLLLNQLALTAERSIQGIDDHQDRSMLVQQMVDLADVALDGYVYQLQSLRRCPGKENRYDDVRQKYEQDRRAVVLQLVHLGERTYAASLAEKYHDFGVLIELCESSGDQDTLQRYMNQFTQQGFSDYLFKWYMDKGERQKLMSIPEPQHEDLARFLSSHHHLSWLHDVQTKAYNQAHETLKGLAFKETGFLAKKKSLLNLSKLALLASDADDVGKLDGKRFIYCSLLFA